MPPQIVEWLKDKMHRRTDPARFQAIEKVVREAIDWPHVHTKERNSSSHRLFYREEPFGDILPEGRLRVSLPINITEILVKHGLADPCSEQRDPDCASEEIESALDVVPALILLRISYLYHAYSSANRGDRTEQDVASVIEPEINTIAHDSETRDVLLAEISKPH